MHREATKRGLRFTGTVKPQRTGALDLEQRTSGQWIVVGSTRLRHGRFTVHVRGVRRGHFRIVLQ